MSATRHSIAIRAAVLLLVGAVTAVLASQIRLTQYRTLDMRAEKPPPHGEYETFTELLKSKRLFDATFQARLIAEGLNLSYSEFRRHVGFHTRPDSSRLTIREGGHPVRFIPRSEEGVIKIRVWDRTPADADKIAAAALESLRDLDRGLWIGDGAIPAGYYRNPLNDGARG